MNPVQGYPLLIIVNGHKLHLTAKKENKNGLVLVYNAGTSCELRKKGIGPCYNDKPSLIFLRNGEISWATFEIKGHTFTLEKCPDGNFIFKEYILKRFWIPLEDDKDGEEKSEEDSEESSVDAKELFQSKTEKKVDSKCCALSKDHFGQLSVPKVISCFEVKFDPSDLKKKDIVVNGMTFTKSHILDDGGTYIIYTGEEYENGKGIIDYNQNLLNIGHFRMGLSEDEYTDFDLSKCDNSFIFKQLIYINKPPGMDKTSCVDKEGNELKEWSTVRIDKCNKCTCIKGRYEHCSKKDCSLYTCESEFDVHKEGRSFIPKGGDCNYCICKNGEPTYCEQYDCDKEHPGCMDEDGNMYKHGESFVPKGDCNSCSCHNGTIGGCTEKLCDDFGTNT